MQSSAHQNLEYCRCPVPPLPEQRAIATALSDVDGLLGGLDRLIAKKRDLKQAAMQQLLTGQTRLPGFHGEWEVKRLGDAGDVVDGGSSERTDVRRSSRRQAIRLDDVNGHFRTSTIMYDDRRRTITRTDREASQVLWRPMLMSCYAYREH